MHSPLSVDERDALTRFVNKLVEDVEKVATLLESRGADSSLPREAQANLRRTLDLLQCVERMEIRLNPRVSEKTS